MGIRGKAGLVPLVLLAALAGSFAHPRGARAEGERDQVLPGCGICYPGGYDINTVGDVRGTVLELQTPAEGPVRLVVAGERERWIVLASPTWFWMTAEPRPVKGDLVTVRGSKSLGADGVLYLVAREIRPQRSETAVLLRDRRGVPLWGGGRRSRGRRGF